jgi:hypothetical protein
MSQPHLLAELGDKAEQEGYNAYEEGAWDIDNPYIRTSMMGRAWKDGWERACEDYAHEDARDAYDKVLDDPRHLAHS